MPEKYWILPTPNIINTGVSLTRRDRPDFRSRPDKTEGTEVAGAAGRPRPWVAFALRHASRGLTSRRRPEGRNGMDIAATAPPGCEFRGRVYDSILGTIGATPLVRLSRLAAEAGVGADILGKCEFFNPLCSVKDRIGLAMIEAAEK